MTTTMRTRWMRITGWAAGVAAAVGLTLGIAGCGQAGGGDGAEVVRYGALGSKIRGLDPMDIGDTTSSSFAGNIFDCLYQYHYLKRPYELIPALAADMPEVSEDGLVYTIRLRQDVVFQDDPAFTQTGGKGRTVTAQDFIYSWKRIANIKNISKNWWIFDGRIAGLDDFRAYTQELGPGEAVDYDRPVEGLEAVDDFTLRITLTKPWPQIVYLLAHLPTAVVPREAVEHYGDEFLNHPVGTGPYRLASWQRGSKIVLERNPTYREERYPSEGEEGDAEAGLLDAAGRPMPFVDRAEFLIVEEDQPRWLMFMRGELDTSGVPKDNFNQAIEAGRELTPQMKDKGIVLTIFDDPATFWMAFNMEDPVVGTNLPLRQAMSLALNRAEYIHLFLNDRGVPARSVLPPMIEGYNPDIDSPYTVYDPDRARELVKEAERVHGGPLPRITLTMGGTDSTARQMGQFMTRAFAAVGIDLRVEHMDWPSAQKKVTTKSAQVYQMGWVADYPDAENFLQLFYGPNASPGPNGTNYDNPEFNAMFERLAVMRDSPERTALVREMEQTVLDDLPLLLLLHRQNFVLQYDWVKNYKPHVFQYGLLKYGDIDVQARREALTN